MSVNVLENTSFDEKIKDISEYLKGKVIEPAEIQKDQILKEANDTKEKIIAQAQIEAKKIVDEAKAKAIAEDNNLQSALRLSAKKSIDALKQTIEKDVLKQTIEKDVKSALSNEQLMKTFISEVVGHYMKNNITDSFEVMMPADLKNKLSDYIKKEISSKVNNKIVMSNESIPSGFSLVNKNANIAFDFSAEAVSQLLSDYLRPELRKYLFK